MPKVSIYLSDEMYRAAQDEGLSISSLAQQAIARELRRGSTDRWIAHVRARTPRVHREIDTAALIDDARAEFGE